MKEKKKDKKVKIVNGKKVIITDKLPSISNTYRVKYMTGVFMNTGKWPWEKV